jgi:hypothetical protein
MMCAKGFPISSPVVKLRSNLSMKSPCSLAVSRRFSSALSGVTSRHSAGGRSRCRLRESVRAKKSPQWPQNETSIGWASVVLQWRWKFSHLPQATPDLVDCPARPVGFRSCKQYPVSHLERARDLKEMVLILLLHRVVDVVRRFLLHSLLDPREVVSLRSGQCPTLLGIWSRQGMMVHSLRIRGREPLRSTPCLLGCIVVLYCWDPGLRPAVGPNHGLRCLQDPATCLPPNSLVGWPLAVLSHHLSYVAIGLLRIAAAFPMGDVGHRYRSWDG